MYCTRCLFRVLQLPNVGDVWSYYMDGDTKRLDSWERIVPAFRFDKETPFFELLVPTIDTVRYGYLMEKLLEVNMSVLYTGGTGVGKSMVAKGLLQSVSEKANYVPVFINFSAQTSSKRTQEMIEGKLEKKRKNILGAPTGKRVIIFVDDLNMPKLDTYGSQPPIELLRQYQDFGGMYDREKLFWKEFQDVTICAACAPPGGGRNPVTPRFVRHFCMLTIPSPSEHSLKTMFTVQSCYSLFQRPSVTFTCCAHDPQALVISPSGNSWQLLTLALCCCRRCWPVSSTSSRTRCVSVPTRSSTPPSKSTSA